MYKKAEDFCTLNKLHIRLIDREKKSLLAKLKKKNKPEQIENCNIYRDVSYIYIYMVGR